MGKKMIFILSSIIILFVTIYFVMDYNNQHVLSENENPYGKDNLHQATIDQLDDPNYRNQIMPDELKGQLEEGKNIVVYFYDPTCSHCQELTPRLVPIAENMNVDMKMLNLLEFQDAWEEYDIESTPTLVYFENGQEIDHVRRAQPNEVFETFFNEYVINDLKGNDGQIN